MFHLNLEPSECVHCLKNTLQRFERRQREVEGESRGFVGAPTARGSLFLTHFLLPLGWGFQSSFGGTEVRRGVGESDLRPGSLSCAPLWALGELSPTHQDHHRSGEFSHEGGEPRKAPTK